MPRLDANPEALSRLYRKGIAAKEIAEALISLGIGKDILTVKDFLKEKELDVVGVSRDGAVVGYLEHTNMDHPTVSGALKRFRRHQILPDDAPIAEIFQALQTQERVFIKSLGVVAGIVTRADMQKIPIRMWLFGREKAVLIGAWPIG